MKKNQWVMRVGECVSRPVFHPLNSMAVSLKGLWSVLKPCSVSLSHWQVALGSLGSQLLHES